MRRPRIGITGATGGLGGGVLRLLAARDAPLRVIVRDPARLPAELTHRDDVQVREARLDSRDAEVARLTEAFAGVTTLYLVSAAEAHDRLDQHRAAVRAAIDAGVERIVYTSFLGASPDATFLHARDHFHTERSLADSGLAVVSLRNSLYADALPHFVEDGVLAGPAGDGRLAPIARADVVEASAALLLDDTWAGWHTLDLTGPELVDLHEVARRLGHHEGVPIHYHDQTRAEAYASRAHLDAPAWLVDAWVSTYVAIERGEMAVVADTVHRLTGHPATALERFDRDTSLPPPLRLDDALQR